MKHWVEFLCIGAVSVAAAVGVYVGIRALQQQANCPTCGKYRAAPGMSASYNAQARWLTETIAGAGRLSDADAERVLLMVAVPVPYPDVDAGSTDKSIIEPYSLYGEAWSAISERLRRGPELSRAHLGRFRDAMVAALERAEQPREIKSLVTHLCYSRLIVDPPVRSIVEGYTSHPDPTVADHARSQLDYQDMITRKAAEGIWKEQFARIVGPSEPM